VLKVIRAYLNSGVMVNGVVMDSEEGTPQGGPLTPPTMLQTTLIRA
jgi:retron-type reverse transcriptase